MKAAEETHSAPKASLDCTRLCKLSFAFQFCLHDAGIFHMVGYHMVTGLSYGYVPIVPYAYDMVTYLYSCLGLDFVLV